MINPGNRMGPRTIQHLPLGVCYALRSHLVGKGNKPATMPLTVPVPEVCRGQRTAGPLIPRPVTGNPIDRRDAYPMVARTAKAAGIPRHISPH